MCSIFVTHFLGGFFHLGFVAFDFLAYFVQGEIVVRVLSDLAFQAFGGGRGRGVGFDLFWCGEQRDLLLDRMRCDAMAQVVVLLMSAALLCDQNPYQSCIYSNLKLTSVLGGPLDSLISFKKTPSL